MTDAKTHQIFNKRIKPYIYIYGLGFGVRVVFGVVVVSHPEPSVLCAPYHLDEGCVEHTMGHVLPYRIVRSWRRYICSVCLWQSKSRATDFPAGYWNSLPRRASHERSPISCLSLYAAFVRSKSTLRWRHAPCLVQRYMTCERTHSLTLTLSE